MSVVWLVLIIAFMVVEAVTYQLICIWFAFGSIGALIASLITDNTVCQAVVFVVISAVSLIALRPAAKRIFKPRGLKTNVEGLIGKEVVITRDVNNLTAVGQGKINGMVWSVRSADDTEIKQGSTAIVERVEGVKLIVRKSGSADEAVINEEAFV